MDWPALLWLAATITLGTAAGATTPRTGLDGSWITAINLAAADERRFGRDIVFTYGPWGFLDRPMLVDRPQFALGMLFAVAATVAMFWAVYACARRAWSTKFAAPVAFAATLATPVTDPGIRLLCAGIAFALLSFANRDGTRSGWRAAWPAAALAALGGLMLQVKFSEGMAVLALSGVLTFATRTLGALAATVAVAAATGATSLLVTWWAAGQPIGGLVPWLQSSLQVASGYQQAMALERPDNMLSYVFAVLLALLVGTLAVRTGLRQPGLAGLGVVLLATGMLAFGFKQGFTRHDAGHEPAFFIITGVLLVAFVPSARRPIAVLTAAALAFALVPRGLDQFDPFAARDRWRASLEAVLNDNYHARLMADARHRARAEYRLSAQMLTEVQGHPVSVDMWEATLPWAYSVSWNPVPVFQAYSAYTPDLDEMNARAIVAAPADQLVLRQAKDAIDGRNTRWETPRYLLALACNYQVVTSDSRWSLLRHGDNRCASPRTVEARDVPAGQAIEAPAVGPDEILVARFTPEPDGFPDALFSMVLKDWSPLLVKADDREFRLPEGLADGPLLMALPGSLGWAKPFDGFHYKRLTFNTPGRLEFQVVALR